MAIDLSTTYMGLKLNNPVIASASPLSAKVDSIKKLEDAGAAAVVMFSLFEEQLRHENEAYDYLSSSGAYSFPEALNYFPEVEEYQAGPDQYLDLLRRAKESTRIPIIASLNGVTNQGWIDFAKQMEQAGADAIELNIYYIQADLKLSGSEVEQQYIDVLKAVKSAVSIPVSLKLSPFFTSMGHMAKQFDEAGADALVMFNRFYQPDFNLESLDVTPGLELSSANEIRLPLLWIAVLYERIGASLAATRGVETHLEVIKYIMAGADAVMTTSALLRNGIQYLDRLLTELELWMENRAYDSIDQMKGCMSQLYVADPSAFERANYIKTLESFKADFIR